MNHSAFNTACIGNVEDESAVVMDVTVHNVIGTMLLQNLSEVSSVGPRTRGFNTRKDAAAQGAYFLVISAWSRGVNGDINLESLAIDVAENVHDERFGSCSVHPTDDVQYSDGSAARVAHSSCGKTSDELTSASDRSCDKACARISKLPTR